MAIQAFIDSGPGIVVASTLHTVGAIAMLGSLAGYVAWTRHLRSGRHQLTVLQMSAVVGYLAVFANLVGGFMRTYQSDHPRLWAFPENTWVQVLAIKHVILFVSMGALVYLFEGIAPRLLRTAPRQRRWTGHAVNCWIVGVGVLVASIMGAAMQITPIGDEDMVEDPGPDVARSFRFVGQLTSSPVAPLTQEGTFDVPEGADGLQAALSWSPRHFSLSLVLTAPDDTTHEAQAATGRATLALAATPGRWHYSVSSELAIQAEWTLDILVEHGDHAHMEDTVVLRPGSFYEINTVMDEGATIAWDWKAAEVVHFDLHTHFDGETQYLEDMSKDAHAGNHTAHREGGYSLLWQVEGPGPVELTFTVRGQFSLHSTVGP